MLKGGSGSDLDKYFLLMIWSGGRGWRGLEGYLYCIRGRGVLMIHVVARERGRGGGDHFSWPCYDRFNVGHQIHENGFNKQHLRNY